MKIVIYFYPSNSIAEKTDPYDKQIVEGKDIQTMTAQVTLTLSDTISRRVRHLAQTRHQDIIALVERILDEALPTYPDEQTWIDLSEPDEAANREMQAYIEMHPSLRQSHFGRFVAIHRGQLIDSDENFEPLYDRIDQAYPEEFVWISEVKEEPIETFVVRSPRFMQDDSQ